VTDALFSGGLLSKYANLSSEQQQCTITDSKHMNFDEVFECV